ncbi:microtubule associated domain-containing protein [Pochonia chlamydosporia 170]|uniref:Microtubule associated domain-containing protein n=1 Tax=Pochonia chlamydosporia 170 TaxID=1380566 RepID=A0A179FMT7_METCM|nr:microtubule associated domain-containing protein [Pochonia chlamydosporia 170]OAQ66608.1 microtubule associated domain-containing protein [Pochonia chlamydosporia 170]
MAHPRFGGALDTPRTNVGDATYLSRQPDFADISQEASFHSPGKDGDFLNELRNGQSNGTSLRTPRQRGPLADRRNLPQNLGGAEFTPMLKSAARHGARKLGKENGTAVMNTPGLDRIDEDDMTPIPRMDSSVFLGSRNQSYLDNTLPQVDSSSVASTPLALQRRKGGDKGPLDGNQLSLREQENVIDRIEKENFGLKLKIHFLEEALRKAGPGFSEAALKENTELKVDKVTMQRELHRYKKHVTATERDLESYRQQLQEAQERARRKQGDEGNRQELSQLQKTLEEKESNIDALQQKINQSQNEEDQIEKLRDNIEDLEADLRERDRQITERDDELDDLRDKLDASEDKAKEAQRRMAELEGVAGDNEELEEAKENIQDLEITIRRLEEQVEELKEKADEAISQKTRAENDLEELQEEMANKSVMTKGLSRQVEEKISRLQEELDRSGKEYAELEKELTSANEENEQLRAEVDEMRNEQDEIQHGRRLDSTRVQDLEAELLAVADEKDLLQGRHEALISESDALQSEVQRLETEVEELQKNVADEREYALEIEKDLRQQYQEELERLNDSISDLQAEVRERDNLYDNDSEKWENEKQALVSERERAEEKAAGLQRTIDRLRETEGNLSSKETALQQAMQSEMERHKSEEAVLTRQIDDLQDALETRQTLLTSLRNELSTVRDELRQTQIDYQAQVGKVATLESEVEVLRAKSSNLGTPGRRDALARDSQYLRDQIARLKADLTTSQSSLAEAKAQRDELQVQIRRNASQENDTLQIDQERLDMRTAKLKLDTEVYRLKDENKSLSERCIAAEKSLEDEIAKATALKASQSKTRSTATSSPASQDLSSAQHTIRELQQKVKDYEDEVIKLEAAGTGADIGSLSTMRKDLSAARQKELDFLRKEAAHRDSIRDFNMQIADLERQLHESKVSQMSRSPAGASAKSKDDAAAIRQRLAESQRALDELRSQSAESERMASQAIEELQKQMGDLADQKLVLEEVLDEANQQAEDAAAENDKALRRLKHQLDKAERERNVAYASQSENSKQGKHLRKSQAEVENLEHDIRQQQELIDALAATESLLRRKLERARSERAAFRMTAEKLQRDIQLLQVSSGPVPSQYDRHAGKIQHHHIKNADNHAFETLVRAAEGAEERHNKELKGMVMQMEWMQARWEREASLRSDAAYAKKFIQLQLDVANACNKAQLRELEHIRTNLLHSKKPLALPVAPSGLAFGKTKATSIRPFLTMARFIARMRIASRNWAQQEQVRLKLVAARDDQRRVKRSKQLKVVRVDA